MKSHSFIYTLVHSYNVLREGKGAIWDLRTLLLVGETDQQAGNYAGWQVRGWGGC